MSNANRKVKPQTTDGKNLQKANALIKELQLQLSQTRMSVLNMRQMYEGAVQEKIAASQQHGAVSRMLTAAIIQNRGKKLTIKESTFDQLDKYAGIDTKVEGGDLQLFAVTKEEMAGMLQDIEEASDEQE
jgi:hypothetical protein